MLDGFGHTGDVAAVDGRVKLLRLPSKAAGTLMPASTNSFTCMASVLTKPHNELASRLN